MVRRRQEQYGIKEGKKSSPQKIATQFSSDNLERKSAERLTPGLSKNLIRSKYRSWRRKEPLCRTLNEWYGRKNASAVINKLATQPVPIQELIEKIIEHDSNPEALEFERIRLAWREIVPEEYRWTAFPYFVRGDVLFIKVHDSCSLMELKMKSREIVLALKAKLGRATFSKIGFLA